MTTIDPGSSAPALRRKRHELEGLILETGRQMIAEQGLGSAAEHLTFKAAFDQLERNDLAVAFRLDFVCHQLLTHAFR